MFILPPIFYNYRRSDFEYSCKCIEGCLQKQEAICPISKVTRNFCKYCRYLRCLNSAGMCTAWVVSAQMPKVEKNPKMTKQDSQKEKKKVEEKPINEYSANENILTPQQLLQHMAQTENDNKAKWRLPDIKVHRNITK